MLLQYTEHKKKNLLSAAKYFLVTSSMFQIWQKARNLCIQPRNEQGEYMAIMAILYTFTPQFLGAQTIYSPQMQRRHVSLVST